MFEELEGIKEQIQFDQINPRFEDNLHRINHIIIPFLGDQEN